MFRRCTVQQHSRFALFLFVLSILNPIVLADCECGYSTTTNDTTHVFTDLLETDFLHSKDIATNTDWVRQVFNVSATASRGVYGTSFQQSNVVSNPLVNTSAWSGTGTVGGNAGLQLHVRGGVPADGLVPTSEVDSSRADIRYGSMRTGMKLSDVAGTCGAFFWYFNDSQEIDMEFLTYNFNKENNTFPLNILMQTATSAQQGFQTVGENYKVVNLPFDPTTAFHEYRIDFHPDVVTFYADGKVLAGMPTSSTLSSPGHLILRNWSNGNPGWSHGPPATDAPMTVSYVKAYFNSSDSSRQSSYTSRCKDTTTTNAVCAIPEQTVAPDGADAQTYFFTNYSNSTRGQIISSGAISGASFYRRMALVFLLATSVAVQVI